MMKPSRTLLLLTLQRALLGNVHSALRQASIQSNETSNVVKLRFEYDGQQHELAKELCSVAAAEVVSDLPPDWDIEEEHVVLAAGEAMCPLELIAFKRAEP